MPKVVNSAALDAIRTGFSAIFARGLAQAEPQWTRVATRVPSSTRENRYGWLGKVPSMREWIGARQVQALSEHDYTIRNRAFELTIGVDRHDIEDDNLGVYEPLVAEMGAAAAAHPDQLVFGALKDGFSQKCFDGQNFFDTEHPVIGADGQTVLVSNSGGGSGTPWFLLVTGRPIKPLILQVRQEPQFVARDDIRDSNVFANREFLYGVDARHNVGYGFWQMAYGSRQALTPANYAAARGAIMSFTGDGGRPLGLVPDLLVVPPALEGAARQILEAEYLSATESNVWRGSAQLLVTPWLV